MNVTIHAYAKEFLEVAGHWLARQEAANSLMLGIAADLASTDKPADPAPVMMTAADGQELAAAILMTPPRGVILYAPGDEPHKAITALAQRQGA